MGLIHVLDTEVSNKIAAGEVVERPLSIVKELVENSIDAGASVINIDIKDGGTALIRVADNGSGMEAEDAKLCFLRHATSKIQTGNDLEAIYTLGFRGEALSSIGAVAKVKLLTKRKQDESGSCVTCEGGEILSANEAYSTNGTVMEVRELFYNTPARLKFLKKPATEAGYIADIISRYVFAHPEISFKLVRDGKEVIFSSGDNKLMNAVYAIYGKDYARSMLEVDYELNGIRITGAIGKGTLARANRNYETFFVNKRYIKSGIMIRALEEAYKNQIMISKFPTAVLNIEVDAKTVDINVHPTKLECKFSNEQGIYQAVYHAVKATLYALPNIPEIERTRPAKENVQQSNFKPQERGEQKSLEEIFREKVQRSTQPVSEFKFKTERREVPVEFKSPVEPEKKMAEPVRDSSVPTPAMSTLEAKETVTYKSVAEPKQNKLDEEIKTPKIETPKIEKNNLEKQEKNVEQKFSDPFMMLDYAMERSAVADKKLTVKDPTVSGGDEKEEKQEDWREYAARKNSEKNAEESIFDDGYFRVIGQLFETYILVEKNNRMLMIDQHAAHERLNYEALKLELAETGISSQMILEPVEIKLTATEFEAYNEHKKLFSELGFETTDNGEDIVTISAVPGDVGWSETEPLFIELLSQTENMKNNVIAAAKERLLYTISCKAAIKANMEISEQEMTQLVHRVFKLKNINTCPHGRPIVISITKKEIEKDFKRIV